MKKIYYLLIICLCSISAYTQTTREIVSEQSRNGTYSFKNASIIARDSDSKTEVFSYNFNDTVSLRQIEELPYPPQPIFLSAHIQRGILTGCVLWNNYKTYDIVNEGRLLLPVENNDMNPVEDGLFAQPYGLSPLCTLTVEGDTATFTIRELYGNSNYDFTLEGILTVILIRDKSNRDKL